MSRERICMVCGAEFYDRQATSIRQKYCSGKCHGIALRERALKTYPPKDEIVALYGGGMTDRELGRKYGHSYQWALLLRRHYGIVGRKRGTWGKKPLSRMRDRARWGIHRKPEKVCRNCGAGGRLDLHHAIPRSFSRAAKYDLRNGLPLCDTCHFGWHNKRLIIHREVFKPDEWAYISSVSMPGRDMAAWLDIRYPGREG